MTSPHKDALDHVGRRTAEQVGRSARSCAESDEHVRRSIVAIERSLRLLKDAVEAAGSRVELRD